MSNQNLPTSVTSYDLAARFLHTRGKPVPRKKLANNTYVERRNDSTIAVRPTRCYRPSEASNVRQHAQDHARQRHGQRNRPRGHGHSGTHGAGRTHTSSAPA